MIPPGIERGLDRAEGPRRRVGIEPGELVALHLADAMLGADRAARGGDQVVDQPRDRRALRALASRARRAARRGRGNGCCRRRDGRSPTRWCRERRASTSAAALGHEAAASRRPRPRCRAGSPGPKRRARPRTGCRGCATTPRPAPRWRRSRRRRPARARSAAPSRRSSRSAAARHRRCRRSPRSARATDARPSSGARVPGMWPSTAPSESAGHHLEALDRGRSRPRAQRSTSSAAAGLARPDPGDAARTDRRDQLQAAAVTTPSVPSAPISSWSRL